MANRLNEFSVNDKKQINNRDVLKCKYTTTVILISRKLYKEVILNISLATHIQYLLYRIDIKNIQFDYIGFIKSERNEKKQLYIKKPVYQKLKQISKHIKLPVSKIAAAIYEGYLY